MKIVKFEQRTELTFYVVHLHLFCERNIPTISIVIDIVMRSMCETNPDNDSVELFQI